MTALLSGFGALAAGLLAVGLILIVRALPPRRRPTLSERMGPYLRDTMGPSRLLASQRADWRRRGARPWETISREVGRRLGRFLGDSDSVRRRQRRAGLRPDVEAFRARQVLWGLTGAGLGMSLAATSWLRGRTSALAAVLVVVMLAGAGVVAADVLLSRAARRRELRMLQEFPTVAELLALSVSAGEGTIAALERLCRRCRGELSGELGVTLAEARAGANLPSALQGLADRTDLVGLRRFVDGVVIALERGTPLAEVLRAQAHDVREDGRRRLMETAGQREIAMMVPVVFLILPITILFAVYPGVALLNLSM